MTFWDTISSGISKFFSPIVSGAKSIYNSVVQPIAAGIQKTGLSSWAANSGLPFISTLGKAVNYAADPTKAGQALTNISQSLDKGDILGAGRQLYQGYKDITS